MKKTANRIICLLTSLLICLAMAFALPTGEQVSAKEDNSGVASYYLTGGTDSRDGFEIVMDSTGSVTFPKVGGCFKQFDNMSIIYDFTSPISRFKFASAFFYESLYSNGYLVSILPYYFYFYGINKETGFISICYVCSASSMKFVLKNNKYVLTSDSSILINFYYFSADKEFLLNKQIITVTYGYYSSTFYCPSDFTDFYNDFVLVCAGKNLHFNFEEIYTNCPNLEINGQKIGEEPPFSVDLKSQVEVKLTPEFGLDMDIKKDYDDRIGFTVTNNSDSPIQFLAYIDTPENKDYFADEYENKVFDYDLPHCIIEPAYEKAVWNYEIEDYYYSLEFSNDSKKLGFQQKCKIDTSKCYGATVFIYLDSGQSYTDNVYWKNIHMSTGKEYRMNFLVFPLSVDTATNIFDIEKYKNEDMHSVFGSKIFKQLHWWTIDYKVSISEIAQIYSVDYTSGFFAYQQNFSVVSIPTYSASSVGGKGLVSQGFANDTALNDKLYNYNMDTGSQTFNSMGSDAFSIDVDVDNISVDNVKEYIKYSSDFFGLIKGTLSTFPSFIWALILFGLTAFVVIALIKWIIH